MELLDVGILLIMLVCFILIANCIIKKEQNK